MAERQLVRDVPMPQFVAELYHGVETSRRTFVLCHQGTSHDKRQYAVSVSDSFFNELRRYISFYLYFCIL